MDLKERVVGCSNFNADREKGATVKGNGMDDVLPLELCILFNRLPSQAMQLDQFWKQVSLRVHREVRHGTPWKALSRWLFLMLEHMESPATSSVATITFSLT